MKPPAERVFETCSLSTCFTYRWTIRRLECSLGGTQVCVLQIASQHLQLPTPGSKDDEMQPDESRGKGFFLKIKGSPDQDKVSQWSQKIQGGSSQGHCIQLTQVDFTHFLKVKISFCSLVIHLQREFPSCQSHRSQHCPHSRSPEFDPPPYSIIMIRTRTGFHADQITNMTTLFSAEQTLCQFHSRPWRPP